MEKTKASVTPEQIEAWKKEHGKVFKYECDGKVCFLRSVDRNTYSLATAKISTSPAKFNDVIIENIWLGGDGDLRKVDAYYFGLIDFVEEMMDKKKGSLVEC